MIVSRNREKLLNAAIYFLRETKHCRMRKLFYLLNFADFENYRQAGRTLTGLEYRAFSKGPVPTGLKKIILPSGVKTKLRFATEIIGRQLNPSTPDGVLVPTGLARVRITEVMRAVPFLSLFYRVYRWFTPKFNPRWFSERELNVLARIAEFFRDLSAEGITRYSLENTTPWARVYDNGRGDGKIIQPDEVFKNEPFMAEMPNVDSDDLSFRKELYRDVA